LPRNDEKIGRALSLAQFKTFLAKRQGRVLLFSSASQTHPGPKTGAQTFSSAASAHSTRNTGPILSDVAADKNVRTPTPKEALVFGDIPHPNPNLWVKAFKS
jgi:hypothetical protein